MNINDFSKNKPKFKLEEYFNGKTEAWGMFHDRFGNLKRSFKVDIVGTLESNTLTLDEKFLYDDGEKDTRIWTIKFLEIINILERLLMLLERHLVFQAVMH